MEQGTETTLNSVNDLGVFNDFNDNAFLTSDKHRELLKLKTLNSLKRQEDSDFKDFNDFNCQFNRDFLQLFKLVNSEFYIPIVVALKYSLVGITLRPYKITYSSSYYTCIPG